MLIVVAIAGFFGLTVLAGELVRAQCHRMIHTPLRPVAVSPTTTLRAAADSVSAAVGNVSAAARPAQATAAA